MSLYCDKEIMRIEFIQKIIDKIRKKYKKVRICGQNNKIVKNKDVKINIFIFGNNNKVLLDESIIDFYGELQIGMPDCPVNNCTVTIKKGSTSHGTRIWLVEDNSMVEIGEDCMFSFETSIDCSDTHSIYDCVTKDLVNLGKYVKIGNHVWIGRNVHICKNTTIPDNCVIGTHSVLTKNFDVTNSVIAGIPAEIKKSNINWSRLRPKQYLENCNVY